MELRRKMRKAAINRGYLATVLAGDGGGVIMPWNRYILSVVVYAKATIWLLKIRYKSKQDKYM